MIFYLYNIVLLLVFPFLLIVFLLKYRRRFVKYFFAGLRERLGTIELPVYKEHKPVIWLHASSIGELNMLKPLIFELRAQFLSHRIYISTNTPEALEEARKTKLADFDFMVPLDFNFIVRRVVREIMPALLLLAESEFWPNLIAEVKKIGSTVGVVNARISDNSFRRIRFFKWWYQYVLSRVDFFGARDREDQNRIISLGIEKDRVVLTGNIKYDAITVPPLMPDQIKKLYLRFLIMPGQPVIVCGSIQHTEAETILKAFTRLRVQYPRCKLILAPRHIDKLPAVERQVKKYKMGYILLSNLSVAGSDHNIPCVIIDTIGDLVDAYRIASVVFVGGSMVPKGGQNIIEPALLEKPVLFGPYMNNFKSSAQELLRCGGAQQVHNAEELGNILIDLIADQSLRNNMGRRAYAAAAGLKGGTLNTIRLIRKWYNGV